MLLSKRRGKFKISWDYLNEFPDIVKKIMGKCIIVDVRGNVLDETFEYVALCDDFTEISLGVQIPEYNVFVNPDTLEVTFS